MKKSKDEVDYSDGMPKAHCGICKYFLRDEQGCTKVSGHILARMWCKLYAPSDN
jgi:hypothetical protein